MVADYPAEDSSDVAVDCIAAAEDYSAATQNCIVVADYIVAVGDCIVAVEDNSAVTQGYIVAAGDKEAVGYSAAEAAYKEHIAALGV